MSNLWRRYTTDSLDLSQTLIKALNLISLSRIVNKMTTTEQQILIVEDDENLGFLLSEFLESEGLQTQLAVNANEAWTHLNRNAFDLCVLDVMMPHIDGFTLAERIKNKYQETPFLFLTAKIMREDRIRGLKLGAEDYITKPFDETELLLRIQNILRRTQKINHDDLKSEYQIGQYTFCPDRQLLHYQNQAYQLTEKENQVLLLLFQHRNEILHREKALKVLYGEADYFLGRSFDVFICKLRKLLQDDSNVEIKNIYKVGFSLVCP